MFMTSSNQEVMEVLTGPERRRRWSVEEKLAMVRESFEPGKTVSMVARQHGVNPNQVFQWRKLYQDGSLSAVSAGEESGAHAWEPGPKPYKQSPVSCRPMLGKKNDEETRYCGKPGKSAGEKSGLRRSQSLPGDDQ
uniref:Transposase n=1 Tax=blood disease bacterium R229 TaxID=741978 RepID=G2ZW45_9RALS|nr:transposase [blood disease bacterium R229]